MRCTACQYSKETIPIQLRYIYCSKYGKEMSIVTNFVKCQYEESEEYKLKQAVDEVEREEIK